MSRIFEKTACEAEFGTLCVLSCIWMTASKDLRGEGGLPRSSVSTNPSAKIKTKHKVNRRDAPVVAAVATGAVMSAYCCVKLKTVIDNNIVCTNTGLLYINNPEHNLLPYRADGNDNIAFVDRSRVYHMTVPSAAAVAAHFFRPAIKSQTCLLYTSPSPRDQRGSRMPSSA